MIHAVRCDKPTFRQVNFTEGLNVVLADRTQESTAKDSRNGLGKSTLIDIIHFCLGSQVRGRTKELAEALPEWTFHLDLSVSGTRMTISRSTSSASVVHVSEDGQEAKEWTTPEWISFLAESMFGLPKDRQKYAPSFRGLISYFVRNGKDAYSSPFEHARKMKEAEKQVFNAYLLGLEWTIARDWQLLKDKKATLDNLRRAAEQGLIEQMVGSIGELEAKKVQLEARKERERRELESFRVHPQYEDIQSQANAITKQIHALMNKNLADDRLTELYKSSIIEEREPSAEGVAKVFNEAGIVFPEAVTKRLTDVVEFHEVLIQNRKGFLQQEIERRERSISDRQSRIETITNERAELMSVLRTHGALQEHNRLQQLHANTESQFRDVEHRIAILRKIEEGASAIKIDQETLLKRARQDLDERTELRKAAITLFNANSEALYDAPGNLIVDVGKAGYKFDVQIERSGSQGIDNMKVLCYDLMLAQLWTKRPCSPRFLIHDSTIFDGVDERQVAHAIELAAQESQDKGFQYICTLNSDAVPVSDFSKEFDFDSHVRLTLTDATDEGRLMGIRF